MIGGLAVAVTVACVGISVASGSEFLPRGIHLVHGGDASATMGISFQTANATTPDYIPAVQIGSASGKYDRTVHGWSLAPYHCGVLSGFQHHVNVTGLAAASKYYYRAGSEQYGWSPQYHFRTAPADGTPHNTTFVLYGDMGVDYSSTSIELIGKLAADDDIDFVVHNGDIAYADNRFRVRNGTMYLDWMDAYYENITRYSTVAPIMFSPGNHEWPCNYSEYERRQALVPHSESGSPTPHYYAHTFGRLRMISLSGEQGRLASNSSLP